MEIAPTGPIPGRTPTSVPRTQPIKTRKRLFGCNAMEKPYNKLFKFSKETPF
jgi:hypothetical protein